MNDDEIVGKLRETSQKKTAVEIAELLRSIAIDGLSQGTLITYFKRAFPQIPLRTLLDASAWGRVSGGGMSDDDFNSLLSPWLGARGDGSDAPPTPSTVSERPKT